MRVLDLVERAFAGRPPRRHEALEVLRLPDAFTPGLVAEVGRVRRAAFGDRVKLNFLLNVKSGLCPEDCHYCSQSKLSSAPIARYPLLSPEQALEAAHLAVARGAKRFCMVASGRGPTEHELESFTRLVAAIRKSHPELEVCASLGLLRPGQAERLRAAGVFAYNHNLNTSRAHYPRICSTHTYQDRVQTLERVAEAGLSPCSGVLLGMGEGDEDIVEVGFALRALAPDSVPINFLMPFEGTPLAGKNELTPWRCLRILCLFRLLFPSSEVRIAGGRELHLRSLQPLGLLLANSVFVGDYLTSRGQAAEADLRMIADLGLTVEGRPELVSVPPPRVEIKTGGDQDRRRPHPLKGSLTTKGSPA